MTYEPTSEGNEFQLTKKQHFHMEAVLKNFVGSDNKVSVTDKKTGLTERYGVGNQRFLAKRAWSQEIEQHLSWPIEIPFDAEVKRIKANGIIEDHEAISSYHLLWVLRHWYALNPSPARQLIPNMPGEIDKRLEEFVESLGKLPLNGGTAKSRFATALDIKDRLGDPSNLANYSGISWQILHSEGSRFISADSYPTRLLLPLGPHILLKGCRKKEDSRLLTDEDVQFFNNIATEEATNFTFG
ncbi:hypothetical protein ACK56M_14620 [Pseudomonas sp. s4]|uniref:hypothetical protein n=1 Tax=Pseudomonas sp. s4 TaxID=353218 RepID=UPI00398D49B0